MAETVADQVARDAVRAALSQIEKHEAICAERWRQHQDSVNQVNESLNAMRVSVQGIYDRFWQIAGATVVVLIGCVGALMWKALTHA